MKMVDLMPARGQIAFAAFDGAGGGPAAYYRAPISRAAVYQVRHMIRAYDRAGFIVKAYYNRGGGVRCNVLGSDIYTLARRH